MNIEKILNRIFPELNNNFIFIYTDDKNFYKIPSVIVQVLYKVKIKYGNSKNTTIKIHKNASFKHSQIILNSNNAYIQLGSGNYSRFKIITTFGNFQKLEIGNNFSCISTTIHLQEGHSSVKIGNDCMFSSEIHIWPTDCHTILHNGIPYNSPTPITIEDKCWLGFRSQILKGTHLKTGTIVANSAVVCGVFKHSNIILAGIPAKIIKSNISWSWKTFSEYSQ